MGEIGESWVIRSAESCPSSIIIDEWIEGKVLVVFQSRELIRCNSKRGYSCKKAFVEYSKSKCEKNSVWNMGFTYYLKSYKTVLYQKVSVNSRIRRRI